jgi:hypothetical protein
MDIGVEILCSRAGVSIWQWLNSEKLSEISEGVFTDSLNVLF